MDEDSKNLREKYEVVETGVWTVKETSEEMKTSKERVPTTNKESQERNVDTVGRKGELRMGYSERREKPLQPTYEVL